MKNLGFYPANLLLPANREPAAMTKWSVVACDQYTSEPDYWQQTEALVGDAPSTLRLTLPEIFLEQPGVEQRIGQIHREMGRYLTEGLLEEFPASFLYLERTLRNGTVRRGLMGMVDLEQYSFTPGSSTLVRATEGTVLERIPPRVKVRENAPLELPHVMLLIDDREQTVIEPLIAQKGRFRQLYSFPLMQESGFLSGYLVDKAAAEQLTAALEALADPEAFRKRYGASARGNVLLYAVGDGNHSLATAKACYEKLKQTLSPEQALCHPARYALAELVNLQDDSLCFEPIHRVVFGVNAAHFMEKLAACYSLSDEAQPGAQCFEVICQEGRKPVWVTNPSSNLAVGTLQSFLDQYLEEFGGRADYIHGEPVVEQLGSQPGNMGFLLPGMEKSQLFETVIVDGVLPRKTFSMGHAWDKRFYLECRAIQK